MMIKIILSFIIRFSIPDLLKSKRSTLSSEIDKLLFASYFDAIKFSKYFQNQNNHFIKFKKIIGEGCRSFIDKISIEYFHNNQFDGLGKFCKLKIEKWKGEKETVDPSIPLIVCRICDEKVLANKMSVR